MTLKDYEKIAMVIWRAGFIKDKNAIRRQAKTDITRLIVSGFVGELKSDPQFNKKEFVKNCGC